LGVAPENIRAVELEYNELSGDWWRYYEPGTRSSQTYLDYDDSPLTVSSGKPQIVRELAAGKAGRKLMIGDGASDLATRGEVDLFVGFGGVVSRPKVKLGSDVFLEVNSLAPILPLAVGAAAYSKTLGTPHQATFERGLELAAQGGLLIQNEDLRRAYDAAFTKKE